MTENEQLVKNMTERFQKNGLEVLYAKCDGFTTPSEVQGVKPDIVGWDPNKELYHLGIVADSKNIQSESIKEKINVLSNMMMRTGASEGERLPFYVGVTEDASNTIDKKLEDDSTASQENIEKIIV